MKIWVVMAKVEELQARSVDKIFDSKKRQSDILKNKTGKRQDIL
jgi:hypothetical protein